MEVRTRYENEMDYLDRRLVQMGTLLLNMLAKVHEALSEHKKLDVEILYASDRQVNKDQLTLINRSVRMLNLEQPVASDLRHLVCILRSVSDLERIGDHIVHIGKILSHHETQHSDTQAELFLSMIDWVTMMLDRCLTAFSLRDAALAQKVIENDLPLDEMHKKMLRRIMQRAQDDATANPEEMMQNLFISRFIERIGDHVVNVCEWCYYSATGQLQEDEHGA